MITARTHCSSTVHGLERQRQRGITDDQLDFTLRYGTRIHVTGAVLYYLRRRDVPWWVGSDYAAKVHGTVAVVSPEGAMMTTYRNPKILHRLKKRPRWDSRRTEKVR